jgi:putative spermidine/putrescine transport system substrate-binding protein
MKNTKMAKEEVMGKAKEKVAGKNQKKVMEKGENVSRRGFIKGVGASLLAMQGLDMIVREAKAAVLTDRLTIEPDKYDAYPDWFPIWEDIEKIAKKEGALNVTAWGAPSAKHHFLQVCRNFEKKYGIKAGYFHGDWFAAQQKVLNDRKLGKLKGGDIDCIFLWGKPFANLLEGDGVWEVPALLIIPNGRKVPYRAEMGRFVHDMVPTYGTFVPHVQWQLHYLYNKKKYKRDQVPATVDGVLEWAKKHPGEFTYCDPHKGGSGHTWIMQLIYSITGGYEKYAFKPFTLDKTKNWHILWDYLNELEKYMYQPGIYPQGNKATAQLFEAGEVNFIPMWDTMMSDDIKAGSCDPGIVGMFVPEPALASPCDGFTIPFNAAHKAAALVFLNYITSPEVQKQMVETVGSLPVVTEAWDLVSEEEKNMPYHPYKNLFEWRDLGTIYARHGKYMFHMMTEWIDKVAKRKA